MKYRKKPVVIEAFRWGYNEPPKWFLEAVADDHVILAYTDDAPIEIRTREGVLRANPGDWIVRGIHGELYPVKPEIFDATYEVTAE